MIGALFLLLTLVVFVGVAYHLTLSPRGPGLLRGLLARHQEQRQSGILAEAQRLAEEEKHRHFHIVVPDYPLLPEPKRPVCYICHSEYPHSKEKRIRALMNIHTQFLVCETCHLDTKPDDHITYGWYSPLESNAHGPFYGTGYDPETGILIRGSNPYAKIAPFYPSRSSGSAQPAVQMQDAPMAKDFMNVRDRLSPEQREGVKNKFHQNIKAKGFTCSKCHSENSILDFNALGFSQVRIDNLKNLAVTGMLEKYDEFYLPEMFQE
ncbi:MAG: hypothetical protein M0036_03440 [Desulfobacteraceae bacterium]|nr:hypothetical protein [Desulfobacteraceae bacterium]